MLTKGFFPTMLWESKTHKAPAVGHTLKKMSESAIAEKAALTKVRGDRLMGEALKAVVHAPENQGIEEHDLLRKTGYYIDYVNEAGEIVKTSYQDDAFYESYTIANGINIKPSKKASAGAPSGARNHVKVAKGTCKILISGAHSQAAGFAEHDKVKIEATEGQILITLLERAGTAPAAAPAPAAAAPAVTDEEDDEFVDEMNDEDDDAFELD